MMFLLLMTSLPCFGQRNPLEPRSPQDLGGRTRLEVQIAYPGGRHVGQYINVRLETGGGGTVDERFTDSEGKVSFTNIPAGAYLLHVRGAGIQETTSGNVNILGSEQFHYEYLQVKPADSGGTVEAAGPPISTTQLKVPAKARKEFDQGTEAMSRGDREQAIRHYRKAIELFPEFAMAYNNLAALYTQSRDFTQAREALSKALEADPELAWTKANLARLEMQEHKYPEAIVLLDKALFKEPNNTEFLFLMCKAQYLAEKFDEAILYAHKVYAAPHQNFEMAHVIAGLALEAQKHPDQARAEYESLLKESPNAPQAVEARRALERLEDGATMKRTR